MKKGEKLFRFVATLILREFCGTVIMLFEAGKVTHVETETRQSWQYRDLPSDQELSEIDEGPTHKHGRVEQHGTQ